MPIHFFSKAKPAQNPDTATTPLEEFNKVVDIELENGCYENFKRLMNGTHSTQMVSHHQMDFFAD